MTAGHALGLVEQDVVLAGRAAMRRGHAEAEHVAGVVFEEVDALAHVAVSLFPRLADLQRLERRHFVDTPPGHGGGLVHVLRTFQRRVSRHAGKAGLGPGKGAVDLFPARLATWASTSPGSAGLTVGSRVSVATSLPSM